MGTAREQGRRKSAEQQTQRGNYRAGAQSRTRGLLDIGLTPAQEAKLKALYSRYNNLTEPKRADVKARLLAKGFPNFALILDDYAAGRVEHYAAPTAKSLAQLQAGLGWPEGDWKVTLLKDVASKGLLDLNAITATDVYTACHKANSGWVTTEFWQGLDNIAGQAGQPTSAFAGTPYADWAGKVDAAGNNDQRIDHAELTAYGQPRFKESKDHFIVDQSFAAMLRDISSLTGERDVQSIASVSARQAVLRHDAQAVIFDVNPAAPSSLFSTVILDGDDLEHSPMVGRAESFYVDPKLEAAHGKRVSANQGTYTGSGLDRGHMNPAAYGANDANKETLNILSNVYPQSALLNQSTWRYLEEEIIRLVTEHGGYARIVVGVNITKSDPQVLSKGTGANERRVAVPDEVYISIQYFKDGYMTPINYLVPNTDAYGAPNRKRDEAIAILKPQRVSIAEIETAIAKGNAGAPISVLGSAVPAATGAQRDKIRQSKNASVDGFESAFFPGQEGASNRFHVGPAAHDMDYFLHCFAQALDGVGASAGGSTPATTGPTTSGTTPTTGTTPSRPPKPANTDAAALAKRVDEAVQKALSGDKNLTATEIKNDIAPAVGKVTNYEEARAALEAIYGPLGKKGPRGGMPSFSDAALTSLTVDIFMQYIGTITPSGISATEVAQAEALLLSVIEKAPHIVTWRLKLHDLVLGMGLRGKVNSKVSKATLDRIKTLLLTGKPQ